MRPNLAQLMTDCQRLTVSLGLLDALGNGAVPLPLRKLEGLHPILAAFLAEFHGGVCTHVAQLICLDFLRAFAHDFD
jgi:hypothetical protein